MTAPDRDRAGRTPLHYAVGDDPVGLNYTAALEDPALAAENFRKGNEYRIANTTRLLARGADVNASDDEGFTPLHFAASRDSVDIVMILLEAGANVNAVSTNGTTPVYNAVRNTTGTSADIVAILMDAGGDPTIEMFNSSSALKFSKRMQKADLLAIFAEHGYQ